MNSIAVDEGRLTFAAAKMYPPERSELRSRLNAGCAEIIHGLLESIRKATSERREYGKGKKVAFVVGSKARGLI